MHVRDVERNWWSVKAGGVLSLDVRVSPNADIRGIRESSFAVEDYTVPANPERIAFTVSRFL